MIVKRRLTPAAASSRFRERFIAEYLIDLNGTQAYLRAKDGSVNERTAASEAWKLLRIPEVLTALAAAKRRQLASADLSAARVLEELRRIAFLNPKLFYAADGSLKNVTELPDEVAACIASMKVARANLDRTDGKRDEEWLHELKHADKLRALDLLAKHFRLVTEVVEHREAIDWDKRIARIKAARRRVGEK